MSLHFTATCIISATLEEDSVTFFQQYSFPSGTSRNEFQLRYVNSRGYSRLRTVLGHLTGYTLTGLSFREEYNITIRARLRFSGCRYSTLYGQYSDKVVAATMETGKYHVNIQYIPITQLRSIKAWDLNLSLISLYQLTTANYMLIVNIINA